MEKDGIGWAVEFEYSCYYWEVIEFCGIVL